MNLKAEICKYSVLSAEHKLVYGAGGNISARSKGSDTFFISATNKSLYGLVPEELVEVRINDGMPISQEGLKPSKEAGMHAAIYRKKTNCNAVIHLHPTYATAMSVLGKEIPMLTVSAQIRLGSVPAIGRYKPGSIELCEAIQKKLDEHPDKENFLLSSHGLLSFGENLETAFQSAELVEQTARIASICEFGKPNGKIYDLSWEMQTGCPVFPGDEPIRMTLYRKHSKDGYNEVKYEMGSHSGTHVDFPMHHLEKGSDGATFPLEVYVGLARVAYLEIDAKKPITIDMIKNYNIGFGDIVLISTNWELNHTKNIYWSDFPYLSPEAANWLINKGVKAVGIDTPSIDKLIPEMTVHHMLLKSGIGIIESLKNLRFLPSTYIWFFALPLKMHGADASPVRAIAVEF